MLTSHKSYSWFLYIKHCFMASKQWLFFKMLHLGTHEIYAENIKTKYMGRCHLIKSWVQQVRKLYLFRWVQAEPSKSNCQYIQVDEVENFFVMEKNNKAAKEATILEAQLLQKVQ